MKIDSSTVGMESARSYRAISTTNRRFSITEYREESLAYNGSKLNTAVKDGQNGNSQTPKENANSSGSKLYTLEDWQSSMRITTRRVSVRSRNVGRDFEELRQRTVRYIFELLFGNKRKWLSGLEDENGAVEEQGNSAEGGETSGSQETRKTVLDIWESTFSMNTASSAYINRNASVSTQSAAYEREDTQFSTVGTVRTADGREIKFNINVGMSRRFQQAFQTNQKPISFKMCDPLVINLDTDVAELSDQKFYFDIDGDGEKDEISRLAAGSGYLALDKNGDGVINDGNELFGTSSGDGFADLEKYDEDGNGWIDENDAIWSKLKIWCKDENGNDVLYRLADKGVGAICLQRAATDFTMMGAQGRVNGAIRSTGVFLYENGSVGTLQHVDVAKYEQGA